MNTTAPAKPTADIAEIKRRAAGRWPEIVPALTIIPADVLDGRHDPCPKCGGTDRFRALDDFRHTGAVLCNQCFSQDNGDGIASYPALRGSRLQDRDSHAGRLSGDADQRQRQGPHGERPRQTTAEESRRRGRLDQGHQGIPFAPK